MELQLSYAEMDDLLQHAYSFVAANQPSQRSSPRQRHGANLQRELSPERYNVGVQTDSPRSLGPASSQYQHQNDCKALEQSNDLEEFKHEARAWYRCCKADPGKVLWNAIHFFFVSEVKKQRYRLFDTHCTCYERPSPSASEQMVRRSSDSSQSSLSSMGY